MIKKTPEAMTEQQATQIGFLLIDGFALMSYASIMEPFRAANVLAGRNLYAWRHYSPNGRAARASNGVDIVVEAGWKGIERIEMLFVCAGGNPAAFAHRPTFAMLRQAAARGARIGGVSGGPYILARAGLLDNYRCTIHWNHESAFAEAFPRIEVLRSLYIIDRNRLSCAGGTAGLDLAIDLIARSHGQRLATRVGEWYIRTQAREGGGSQRLSIRERYGVSQKHLLKALALMEANVGEPLSRDEIARDVGMSLRQLERLFTAHIGRTIGEEYLRIRLVDSLRLLNETSMSRIEVAIACGFVSPSHFSRSFRNQFGITPTEARAKATFAYAE
jgi:transcriptional regulator GlxA family with amidase domain